MRNSMPILISLIFGVIFLFSGCTSCDQLPPDDPGSDLEEDVGLNSDTGFDRDVGGSFDVGSDSDTGADTDTDTDADTDANTGTDTGADSGDENDTGNPDSGQTDTDIDACGDCSDLDDECNQGVCDEALGECFQEPINIGQSCDDGQYCTVNQTCNADGECVGEPRDCSHLDELCRTGFCQEDGKSKGCVAIDHSHKMPCDTGQFCVINEKCTFGECVGDPRDCSSLDDQCHQGVCNESAGQCDQINLCSACDEGIPIADAGPNQEVVPNTVVTLDGGGSIDPSGQDLSYQWQVTSRPDASSATIADPTSKTPTLLADLAGTFTVCLTVNNEDQCVSDPSCININVVPQAELHIELLWHMGVDSAEEPTDLDLHYRTPQGSWFSGHDELACPDGDNQSDSVWWCVPNPDWGGGADGSEPDGISENDPLLDVDNLVGDGPENINQELLFDGEGFRVGVHNFRDNGHGPVEARVRIYINGELEFEAFETIECKMFWEVAELNIYNGGTQVEINALDEDHFEGPVGYCGD